jgi:antirestriction protein ArdC
MKITDKIVDMVINGLENGTAPWRKTWKVIPPMNFISQRQYSGLNIYLLSFWSEQNRYAHPLFATFRQISEAGGRVKKGETAFPVIYWKVFDKTVQDDETADIEIEKRFTPFYYNVFNLSQTEGMDAEKFIPESSGKNNRSLEICETVVQNMPHPPRITHGKPGAFYAPSRDMVNIPEISRFESSEEYYAVMFHELAHSTGHKSRLDRFVENREIFGRNSYDFEELVAEMAATILCSGCGIEQTEENSVSYLTGWAKFLKENRKTALFSASTKAWMAANHILGKPVESYRTEQAETA